MNLWDLRRSIPGERVRTLGRLLFLCALVGMLAGLAAIAFYWALDFCQHVFFDEMAGYRPAGPGGEHPLLEQTQNPFRRWVLFFLPVIGGLLSGLLVYGLAPEAEGHGTDAAIFAYHHERGRIRARVPLVKALASAITIGSGGSAGREGPIAQIAAGVGSQIASILKLSTHERRILMISGMGAGIGAIFHAPLAGALFSAEVLYKEMDLEHEVIVPAMISSIIAYGIFAIRFGWDSLFLTPNFNFDNLAQLGPYFALALIVALGASLYVRTLFGTRDLFQKIPMPNHLKPMLGGLLVGSFAFFLPEAMGSGYGVIQTALTGTITIPLLLAVAGGKILTTSFTIGSGGSGGVFGPSVVIGGSLGGAVGMLSQQLLPNMGIQPGSFVIVGMAGFFAAAANTPISTIIMVSEMTGNYYLLVPSMWVCIIAYLLVRRSTLYEQQVSTRIDAPSHLGEMMGDILKRMRVKDVIEKDGRDQISPVYEGTSLSDLQELFANAHYSCFPLVDSEGKLTGVVNARELRYTVGRAGLAPLIVAKDLAISPPLLTQEETLLSAVQKMVRSRQDELVVVERDDPTSVVGIVSRNDLISSYDRRIAEEESARNGQD